VYIISYELAAKIRHRILDEKKLKVCIADEIQMFRNDALSYSKAIIHVICEMKRVILLSGYILFIINIL
jgi:hypothetical protein